MIIKHITLRNWKNFEKVDIDLSQRTLLIGPNACGKSNFMDSIKFMLDIVKPGGGLEKALKDRGGISKIRTLSARRYPEVILEFHLAETINSKANWEYTLSIKYEGKGRQRSFVNQETVKKNGVIILERPNQSDMKDDWRLTQTHLEQVNSNSNFREIANFFNSVTYMHLIPQLIRRPDTFFNPKISPHEDPYGFYFLERIAKTPERTKKARLKKIENALRLAVPQLKELTAIRDKRGVPHIEAIYEHWRPNAGKQQEDQFSDGTLRLIGILWSILESNSLLLLEEPELSLHPEIVKQLPSLFYRLTRAKKPRQQIIFSSHSPSLLQDQGIGGNEVLIFFPELEGTTIKKASDFTLLITIGR